jgi:hypothetical protein
MRLKLLAALLAASTVMQPVEAHAFVVSAVVGFVGGVLLGAFGLVTPLLGVGALGVVNAGFAAAAFLTSGFGAILLSVGASAAQYLLAQRRPGFQAPSMEAARVNVRVPEGERWWHAGISRSGGAVLFGEFDSSGNFWYVVVHGDAELMGIEQRFFDDRAIEVDANGWVITNEFCLNGNGDPYTGSGTRVPYYRIWTTTYSVTDPVPPPIADFKTAFPQWTDDHKLAGTTYSVIRARNIAIENRHKIYRWGGSFGQVGVPSFSIAGRWERCFDPRDGTQLLNDRSTWKFTSNTALIWARYRTYRYGRNKPLASINWDKVAEQAAICDQAVEGIEGVQPRYACGISIPEGKERHVGEAEILVTADAAIMHDAEGRAYPKVGYYEVPTVTLTRNRDIMAMASREATDGEMETDGVIVRYIEPEFGYQVQPCSPWVNPIYFREGETPRYMTIDVLACQNHNQAMRLAKAIGLRSQSSHRLAPTVGLRGLRARRERIIDLQYDATFSGDYEIATPVEVDENGLLSSFGCVPVDPNRWTLLEGEENSRPAPIVPIPGAGDPVMPTGVSVYAAPVSGSGGASVRIEATFNANPRPDHRYEFSYQLADDTTWRPMIVRMEEQLSYSDTVPNGQTHRVRWRTVASSGRATEWLDPPVEVLAVADTDPPDPVLNVSATGGTGSVDLEWTAPNSGNYFATRVLGSTTDDIGTSVLIWVEFGAPNATEQIEITSLGAGTYYFWLVAVNGSGVASSAVATGAVAVT